MKKLFTVSLMIFCSPLWAATHGATFDLGHGLGYTLYSGNMWGGLSLHASQDRFSDNQVILKPSVYANYNLRDGEVANFFAGVSYSDRFGLRNDHVIDKIRLLAFTAGVVGNISEKLRVSSWANVWGIHEELNYNPDSGNRRFGDANRQTFMEFGGLMLTYIF